MGSTLTLAEQAKLAQAKVQASSGNTQLVETMEYDAARWEDLVNLIGATYEGFALNSKGIEKAGKTATDAPLVLCALKRTKPTKASVTLYSSGKAVFCGIEPVRLDEAPKLRRERKPKPQPEPTPTA